MVEKEIGFYFAPEPWWSYYRDQIGFLGCVDNVKTKEIRNHDLTNKDDIISLWNTIRFPLLNKEFVNTVVMCSDQFGPFISLTESYLAAAALYHYTCEGKLFLLTISCHPYWTYQLLYYLLALRCSIDHLIYFIM